MAERESNLGIDTVNTGHRDIILASTSPFRRELLQRLGLSFSTVNPDIDEQQLPDEPPYQLVTRLAEMKARACGQVNNDALIIGSDQVAVCDNRILGKPGDHENAVQQLNLLSGKRVSFYTGLCLLDTASAKSRTDAVIYSVEFRQLSNEQIERYLVNERPYNCAGSFKSEGLGISLFKKMDGDDPTALIGLPLIRLVEWLNEAGVTIP